MKRSIPSALLAATALALAAPASAQAPCDRTCLIALADTYADALVADDPGRLNWAPGARLVENLTDIPPGSGAFDTITGHGSDQYALHVADPISRQVGLLAMMAEGDAPVFIGIRLKINEAGAITEAEHLIARNLSPAQLANLQAPRPALLAPVPEGWSDSRAAQIRLGLSYYDALDNNNSRHSNMADDCERRENGFQTARNPMVRQSPGGNGQFDPIFAYLGGLGCAAQMDTNMWEYISRIVNRRVEIADPVSGLVWGMSHFEHDFATNRFALVGVPWATHRELNFQPFDMPAIHVYKVWGGAIHEIEALGIVMPYRSPRGFTAE